VYDSCCLEASSSQISLSGLIRPEDFLEDKRATLLARANLIDKNLCADVIELITRALGASFLEKLRGGSLRMTVREITQHILPVLVNAVQEKVLKLAFV